jgi:hypothetical protein
MPVFVEEWSAEHVATPRRHLWSCRIPIVDRDSEFASESSGHRSAYGTHCHADGSALRGCDESRGTRYSERHSAH